MGAIGGQREPPYVLLGHRRVRSRTDENYEFYLFTFSLFKRAPPSPLFAGVAMGGAFSSPHKVNVIIVGLDNSGKRCAPARGAV